MTETQRQRYIFIEKIVITLILFNFVCVTAIACTIL